MCVTCKRAAFNTIGACQDCGKRRLLPGRDHHRHLCAPCAKLPGFVCRVCDAADTAMANSHVCVTCDLHQRLTLQLTTSGTPLTANGAALIALLATQPSRAMRRWLADKPAHVIVLRSIADGTAPLAHATIDSLGDTQQVERFRRLLITAGLLDDEHYKLALFDRWTARFLPTITNPIDRTTITSFIAWGERRRLSRDIDIGNLKPWSTRSARQRVKGAAWFLAWLVEHDTTLAACTQANIETWITSGNTTRSHSVAFIVWAQTQHLCNHRLHITPAKPATPTEMPPGQRVELIARLINDTTLRLDLRVAGLLVTLYAQPVSRICQIRRDDIIATTNATTVVINGSHLELIAPLDQLLSAQAARHTNTWLFPGATPGQPASATTIGDHLRRLGINQTARVAALHDLITHIPGPVLADLIGYNPNFVAERAATLGAPWQNYPALRQTPRSAKTT